MPLSGLVQLPRALPSTGMHGRRLPTLECVHRAGTAGTKSALAPCVNRPIICFAHYPPINRVQILRRDLISSSQKGAETPNSKISRPSPNPNFPRPPLPSSIHTPSSHRSQNIIAQYVFQRPPPRRLCPGQRPRFQHLLPTIPRPHHHCRQLGRHSRGSQHQQRSRDGPLRRRQQQRSRRQPKDQLVPSHLLHRGPFSRLLVELAQGVCCIFST